MTIDERKLLVDIQTGKGSRLELKQVEVLGQRVRAPRKTSLADEIAAFANSAGGRLVLGVTDSRKIQKLSPEQLDVLMRFVREICRDQLKPALDCAAHRVNFPSPVNGSVLLLEIPQSIDVHESPGGFLLRSFDAKRKMDSSEVRRLSFSRGQSDIAHFDSRIVNDTGVETIDEELWQRYIDSRQARATEDALTSLKFVKRDGSDEFRATVCGILMATKAPRDWLPNAWVQAVRYSGTRRDGNNQLDARDITGPLDQQIRDAVQFVMNNRRVAAYKAPARVEVPQYSDRAIFEAIVNAVVHRDYSITGSHIRLFMFDDRIEIHSPGTLCNSMTPKDLRVSQFTRNEALATKLGQCEIGDVIGSGNRRYFIERRGEGVPTILDETFALTGRYPKLEILGGREFRVVLPAASLPIPEGLGVAISVSCSDTKHNLSGVHVLLLFPNKTWREATTDTFGRAEFVLHTKLPMTVLVAADGYRALVVRDYLPNEPLRAELKPTTKGGSMIFAEGGGTVQKIRGHLSPILDELDRMYLYGHNLAINDGKAQPVRFNLNEAVRILDSYGNRKTLWFREFIGKSCIFDYE